MNISHSKDMQEYLGGKFLSATEYNVSQSVQGSLECEKARPKTIQRPMTAKVGLKGTAKGVRKSCPTRVKMRKIFKPHENTGVSEVPITPKPTEDTIKFTGVKVLKKEILKDIEYRIFC